MPQVKPSQPMREDETLLQAAPFPTLDDKTKSKLEKLRRQTPRYLFRAWKASISGGHASLNTETDIIPLAFRTGGGYASVYHMSKKELTNMVVKHVDYETQNFRTEFSSWTASLSYTMVFFGSEPGQSEDVYISIIDTQALVAHSDTCIFFVPGLSFLTNRKNLKSLHHEYLAHSHIRGNALRAVPLQVFLKAGFNPQEFHIPGAKIEKFRPRSMTAPAVRRARTVAEQYGRQFAMPVALALLCLEERRPNLFLREGDKDLEKVLTGLNDLHIPHQSWSQNTVIMEDVVYMGDYLDIRQFIHLMRAIVRHQLRNLHVQNVATVAEPTMEIAVKNDHAKNERPKTKDKLQHTCKQSLDKLNDFKWWVRFNNGKAKLFKKMRREVHQRPIKRNAARVVKSGGSRRVVKIPVETAALDRAMKKLDIDMNRYGRKDNHDKNEQETEDGSTGVMPD